MVLEYFYCFLQEQAIQADIAQWVTAAGIFYPLSGV